MVSSGSSIFVFSTIWIGREAICMNGFRGYKEIYCYSKCSRFDKTENMKKKKWVGNKKKNAILVCIITTKMVQFRFLKND